VQWEEVMQFNVLECSFYVLSQLESAYFTSGKRPNRVLDHLFWCRIATLGVSMRLRVKRYYINQDCVFG
jgi:hypothetical protein